MFVLHRSQRLREVWVVWMGFDVDECVGCACGVEWVGAMLWCEHGVQYL
jgi:hypothetical protein